MKLSPTATFQSQLDESPLRANVTTRNWLQKRRPVILQTADYSLGEKIHTSLEIKQTIGETDLLLDTFQDYKFTRRVPNRIAITQK